MAFDDDTKCGNKYIGDSVADYPNLVLTSKTPRRKKLPHMVLHVHVVEALACGEHAIRSWFVSKMPDDSSSLFEHHLVFAVRATVAVPFFML